jgi:hypothetical protein
MIRLIHCFIPRGQLSEELHPETIVLMIANHGHDPYGIGGGKLNLHQVAWFKTKRRAKGHTAPAYFGGAASNDAG